jgi:hypothetical protein
LNADRAPQLKATVVLLSSGKGELMKLVATAAPFILVAFSIPLGAQSTDEGVRAIQSKLLDVPSGAYKLIASRNGRGYEFTNDSQVTIIEMQLGCAKKKGHTVRILSVRPTEDVDLAPSHFRFWQANHGFFPGEACKKGKLAVVLIKFADGTQWKLKP